MGNRVILIVMDGAVRPKQVRRPPAPRPLRVWLEAAREKAVEWHIQRYAFRYGARWHVFDVGQKDPIKSFPLNAPQQAVDMYLLMMREPAHD